ncbi:MAG: oxidoreductase, partial [Candidatus Cloacimonas sp. 4484_209]
MKQVIQNYRTGEIKLEEVPVPLCKSGGVLVQNVCSVISVGTEKLMIDMAKKSLLGKAIARPDLVRLVYQTAKREGIINTFKEAMNRLDQPVPLGYSSAGVVVEVGKGAEEFKVGDRVACAGADFASHAEVVWVPKNLCVHIPKRQLQVDNYISFEEAAFVMLGAIALHGVRLAGLTFGEIVAVIGLGLIGLITVQILKAVGCVVIGSDIEWRKCELAKQLGADQVAHSSQLVAHSNSF